jgi:hypothetical protein
VLSWTSVYETNIWSIALYGAEMWKLRNVNHKYQEGSKMWCRKRMEISWTDHVRNEEILHTVKGKTIILYTIKGKKRLNGLVIPYVGLPFKSHY